jgi:hypothetical protein
VVARAFANKHDAGASVPVARDRFRAGFAEVAFGADGDFGGDLLQFLLRHSSLRYSDFNIRSFNILKADRYEAFLSPLQPWDIVRATCQKGQLLLHQGEEKGQTPAA